MHLDDNEKEMLLPDEESKVTQKEINHSLNESSETCDMVKLVKSDWPELEVGQGQVTLTLTWDVKNELTIHYGKENITHRFCFFDILGVRHPGARKAVNHYIKPANLLAQIEPEKV